MSKKLLVWVDDCRDPWVDDWLVFSPIPRSNLEVVWCRSYQEFIDFIELNQLPDAVCFDHDLGDIGSGTEEMIGLDCAKYLVNHCMSRGLVLPKFSSQSANPVGRKNILSFLENYVKFESNR